MSDQQFRIERLGHLGDGIAEGPVYAARTLPGEVVTGVLVDDTRLTDVRIAEPSPHRVSPPCRHARACGGCQVQHADNEFVANWKTEIIRSALNSHGLETDIREIATSPDQSRIRATLAARRTKKGALVGFHAPASDTLVAVPGCLLVVPELRSAMGVCGELAALGASRKSTLSVSVTHSEAGLDVSVTDGKPLDNALRGALTDLVQSSDVARLGWNGEVLLTLRPPVQRFAEIPVVPPLGAFLQATREGAEVLQHAVAEAIGSARNIADLFSGCGTFALPLARQAEVVAVEGDADMLDALDHAWRRATGLKRIETRTRDLFRNPLLPDELRDFDAVVVDPPRAGAERQVEQIAAADVPRLAYVSCNPVTFARDARQLVDAGYRLDWVKPVDQFRWSTHVELASQFTRS